MTSTGSTSNGVLQYSLNMVATVLTTMLALARSVAVHSMNTSRVSSVICWAQARLTMCGQCITNNDRQSAVRDSLSHQQILLRA